MDDALLDDALNGDFWTEEDGWNSALKAEVAPVKEHDPSEVATEPAPEGVDFYMFQEKVGFVSARVPLSLKYRYDDHVALARRTNGILSGLDKAEAMVCLLRLLDDPEVRDKWVALARSRVKR